MGLWIMHTHQKTGNWLLVDRHMVDLSGAFCDKIGTDHRAFRNQPRGCIQPRER